MRNASGHQVKKERRRKKVNRTAYKIFSMKRVSRKFFHVVVLQNNGKEMYKKSVLHVQSCCCCFFFLLIRPILFVCLFFFAVFVAVAAWLA